MIYFSLRMSWARLKRFFLKSHDKPRVNVKRGRVAFMSINRNGLMCMMHRENAVRPKHFTTYGSTGRANTYLLTCLENWHVRMGGLMC